MKIEGYIRPNERKVSILNTCGYCIHSNTMEYKTEKYEYRCGLNNNRIVDEYGSCPKFSRTIGDDDGVLNV